MSLLDAIVARRVLSGRVGIDSPRLLSGDRLESPWAYAGWLLPVRLFAAVRYHRLKREVLSGYAFARRIPRSSEAFHRDLAELACARAGCAPEAMPSLPWWSLALRAWIVYPAIVCVALSAGWAWSEWRERERLHHAMSVLVPNYADAVHARASLGVAVVMGAEVSPGERARAQVRAASLRERIVDALPDEESLRRATRRALNAMDDDHVDDDALQEAMIAWQQALRASGVAYLVEAHVQRAPCLTLMPGSFETRAMSVVLSRQSSPADEERCRVTVLLPYHVRSHQTYVSGGAEHRLAVLHRADTMPVAETALGLTFRDARGSHVYADRIRHYMMENVVPALESDGVPAMFPLWVRLTPEGERLATRAIRTSLRNVYGDGLASLTERARDAAAERDGIERARLAQTLHAMGQERRETSRNSWDQLGLDAISSSMLGAQGPMHGREPLAVPELEALEERLVRAITAHELEHQILGGAIEPSWLRAGIEGELSPELLEAVRQETAGYLRGLLAGEDIRHLLLAQLLSFVANPLARLYTERIASRIILLSLADCREARPPAISLGGHGPPGSRSALAHPPVLGALARAPIRMEHDHESVMDAFTSLVESADDASLGRFAQCAYAGIFGRPPAELRPR